MLYNEVLEKARGIVEKEKPEASAQKHAAFANSVAYLVTGASGGYGGPSVREHAAARLRNRAYSFEEAVKELLDDNGLIFGPIIDIHRQCWENEHCFNDDPEDILLLEGSAVMWLKFLYSKG